MDLHDATLRTLTVDWTSRTLEMRFESVAGPVAAQATELSLLHAPRSEKWGPSSSVLRVDVPIQTDDGKLRLVIEMQSGDSVVIEAGQITDPAPLKP